MEHVEAQQAPHFAHGICRCLGYLHADIPVDSYHLEVEVADLYVLAHQRMVVFAEFLGLASAQHHILALVLHIDFVDESSGYHLRLVDFGMCRSHTHQ